MRKDFAQLMDVSEEQVYEEDLPVVAIAGSGGGASQLHSSPLTVYFIQCQGTAQC